MLTPTSVCKVRRKGKFVRVNEQEQQPGQHSAVLVSLTFDSVEYVAFCCLLLLRIFGRKDLYDPRFSPGVVMALSLPPLSSCVGSVPACRSVRAFLPCLRMGGEMLWIVQVELRKRKKGGSEAISQCRRSGNAGKQKQCDTSTTRNLSTARAIFKSSLQV